MELQCSKNGLMLTNRKHVILKDKPLIYAGYGEETICMYRSK